MSFSVARAGLFTEDPDIISDCLWTISYIADTHDESIIETLAENECIVRLIELMGS